MNDAELCKALRSIYIHSQDSGTVLQAADRIEALAGRAARLESALRELVAVNEQHNSDCARVIGRPLGWKDAYLKNAREALK